MDNKESHDLLIEAGERGSVSAQRELGAYFATGDWIGEKDGAKAIEWYTAAAEQGHAESQYDLGFMLLLGEGTDQNTLKGMEWLIKAAEQGNDSACELLADIYLKACLMSPLVMSNRSIGRNVFSREAKSNGRLQPSASLRCAANSVHKLATTLQTNGDRLCRQYPVARESTSHAYPFNRDAHLTRR